MKNCKGYEKYEQGYQSEFILSTLIISSFELSVAYFSVGDIFFRSRWSFFGNSPRGGMRQGPVGVSGLQLYECMHLCVYVLVG